MICPYCSHATQVANSRSHNAGQGVWRRRRCTNCKAVWTTTETYDLGSTHRVITASQATPQPFSRDVLFISIKDSLAHRKTATADASALTDTVIRKVLSQHQAILETSVIERLAQETLQAFDPTAAAVYSAKHGSGNN